MTKILLRLSFLEDWGVHLSAALVIIGLIAFLGQRITLSNAFPIVLGTFLIDIIDHPAYVYITNRKKETSIQARQLLDSGQIVAALQFWSENHKKENRLLIHSVLGQPILAFTFLFMAVSQNYSFTFFVIFGMFLHTIIDQSLDLKRMGHLKHWFFWPIHHRIETATMILLYTSMVSIFVFGISYLIH